MPVLCVQPHGLSVVLWDPSAMVAHKPKVAMRIGRVPVGRSLDQLFEPLNLNLARDPQKRAADWAHLCWHVALAAVRLPAPGALTALAVVILVDQADRTQALRVISIVFTTGSDRRWCPAAMPKAAARMLRPRQASAAACSRPCGCRRV